jgi:RHS repeat-associated protein
MHVHDVLARLGPVQRRYFQCDLVGYRGGISMYGYIGANPLNYSDPTGLATPGTH